MKPTTHVLDAYDHCEGITRSQAKNFSYGIRLLPGPKRRALSAVYAFARRVDDIGDGDLPQEQKLAGLARARADIRAASLDSPDPVLVALAHARERMAQLVHYCRCVAGSVGRLSLGVFGADDVAAAAPQADALGVALQLTNILRDVLADRHDDRVYLPAEDLDRFGVRLDLTDGGMLADAPPSYAALVRFEADRAERWYADGMRLLSRLDRRSRACCACCAAMLLGLPAAAAQARRGR